MKKDFLYLLFTILFFFVFFISNACSLELITKDVTRQKVISTSDLIKLADNAIFLFNTSSSMDEPYKDSGTTKYQILIETLKKRNSHFPDLGHNIGLYVNMPWDDLYPVQKFNQENFAQALNHIPSKAAQLPSLKKGLNKLESVLKNLHGKTIVFIFTDGLYSRKNNENQTPVELAKALTKKYNISFYLINTGDDESGTNLQNKIDNLDFSVRAINLEDFIDRPEHNTAVLYAVKSKKRIITVTEKKIVSMKTNSILFDSNSSILSKQTKKDLELLALFLNDNKHAYAALFGHTDGIGDKKDNMKLSFKRVEAIAMFLVNHFNVDKSQLITFWFGQTNPVADNSTQEGRMLNRRVEILIGGL